MWSYVEELFGPSESTKDDAQEEARATLAATPRVEKLAALHAEMRSDLEAAPLEELCLAARDASQANAVDPASAGGWKISEAMATMRRGEDNNKPEAEAGWAPFVATTTRSLSPQGIPKRKARLPETSSWGKAFVFDDGIDERPSSRGRKVFFMDGGHVVVEETRLAFDLLRKAAKALEVEARDAGALGLYEENGKQLTRLISPSDVVGANVKVVVAVRLFTAPIHAAALRGLREKATPGEGALARLLYAQTVANIMHGTFAVLPRVDDLNDDDSDRDSTTSDDENTWRDSFPATSTRAKKTRLRFGALRLWSRALKQSKDVIETAQELLASYGVANFMPRPVASEEALLTELRTLVFDDFEIETTAGSQTTADTSTPESAYVELAARSPNYGATLFALSDKKWLAISRRGASILAAGAQHRLQDIPLDCARRWRDQNNHVSLDYERPPNRWPRAAQTRREDTHREDNSSPSKEDIPNENEDASYLSSLSSYFQNNETTTARVTVVEPSVEPSFSDDDEFDDAEPLDSKEVETGEIYVAEMMRLHFDLLVTGGAAGGAREAVSLLDDYCLCDLAETPPTFGWQQDSEEEVAQRPTRASMPGFYDALVCAVVRPPRFYYEARLLGPSSFRFGGHRFHRQDLVLVNRRKERLHVSRWQRIDNTKKKTFPAVVFAHANSASRAQACHYLSLVLSLGCSLVAFDCAGSGLSDGSLVTLGWREALDLKVVLEWLQKEPNVSKVAVWGQSMGAAAILYYQGLAKLHSEGQSLYEEEEDLDQSLCDVSRHVVDRRLKNPRSSQRPKPWPVVDCVVLDSPYSDFQKLAAHVANERRAFFGGFSLPTVVLDLLLSSLDASVMKKAGFSPLAKLSPIAHAPRCKCSRCFGP